MTGPRGAWSTGTRICRSSSRAAEPQAAIPFAAQLPAALAFAENGPGIVTADTAKKMLKAQGHQNVKSMWGGIGAWAEAGLPTQEG